MSATAGSPRLAPFAYGADGRYLVTTDDRVVWITCLDDNTSCSGEVDAAVAGVRTTPTGVLVVDVTGRLSHFDVEAGDVTPVAECAVPATWLAGNADVWAVVHPAGVCLGRADQLVRRIDVPGALCAAFDDAGGLLCVGTQGGEAVTFDLETNQRRAVSVKELVTGLCSSPHGWWLVTTQHQVSRVERDLSRVTRLQSPERRASGGVVSPDGSLIAYRHGKREVIVFGVNEGVVAHATYSDRTVGEIEFGPYPWLAVGLGDGDCNRFALDHYRVQCAPDSPDRPQKSWQFHYELNVDRIRAERDKLRAAGLLEPGEDPRPPDKEDELEEEVMEDEAVEPAHPEVIRTAPFTLAPGEGVLLKGGFGGKWGWTWLGVLLAVSLLLLLPMALRGGRSGPVVGVVFLVTFAAAFWPLLRSGTYWLTTHRLHWKPWLGQAVAVSVAGLDRQGGTIHPLTSSLSIGDSLSLNYIRGVERLWGGLLLLNELGEIDLADDAGDLADVAWFPATATDGLLTSQKGVAVLRPGYVAFLPTHEPRHVIKAMLGWLGKKVLSKVLGFDMPEANPQVPFDAFVPVLLRSRPDEFDDIIRETVERFASVLWEEGEADVTEEGLLLGDRHTLVFRQGQTTVSGVPEPRHTAFVESRLSAWTDGLPVPRRQPVLRGLAWAVALTVPAVLFAYGALGMTRAARLDLGEVSPAKAIDPAAVPPLAFVSVSGRPDLKHKAYPLQRNLLVVLEGQPGLVLYVQKSHPLHQALTADDRVGLKRPWTLEGRVFDHGQSAAPFLNLDWKTIDKFASTELKATDVRLLAVGMKADSIAGNGWLAWGVATLLGVPAGAFWLLTTRAALRPRGDRLAVPRRTKMVMASPARVG